MRQLLEARGVVVLGLAVVALAGRPSPACAESDLAVTVVNQTCNPCVAGQMLTITSTVTNLGPALDPSVHLRVETPALTTEPVDGSWSTTHGTVEPSSGYFLDYAEMLYYWLVEVGPLATGNSATFTYSVDLEMEGSPESSLEVNWPPDLAGPWEHRGGSFGPLHKDWGTTANLEWVDDGSAFPSLGCDALVGFTPGNIALIDRGSCEFSFKALAAETAGAAAAIIVNNDPSQPLAGILMGPGEHGDEVTIPVLMITYDDGSILRYRILTMGDTVNATVGHTGVTDLWAVDSVAYTFDETADPDCDPECGPGTDNFASFATSVVGDMHAPGADFTWAPQTPTDGRIVSFTDRSVGQPVSWQWDFGDGATSSEQHPRHAFAEPGTYPVSLTVANAAGSDSVSHDLVVAPLVEPGFVWSPATPEVGSQVLFMVAGLTGVESTRWDFGRDGCPGYSRLTTCVTSLPLEDCLEQPFVYGEPGVGTTVTLWVTVGGEELGPFTGSVDVGGGTCDGSGCSYSFSPPTAQFGADGGNGTVAVTPSAATCTWAARSNSPWIHVMSGASGTGEGDVHYVVDSNPGATRIGTLTIAGSSFEVTQFGGGSATMDFTISDRAPDIGEVVTFEAGPECASPERWELGGASCDGDSEIVCPPIASLCRSVTWRYRSAGVKTVRLDCGEGWGTKSLEVQPVGVCDSSCDLDAPPEASFTLDPNPAELGEPVRFTDTSSQPPKSAPDGWAGGNLPTQWFWAVTRGGQLEVTSDQPVFTHVFDTPGDYTVAMTASNCRGPDFAVATLVVTEVQFVPPSRVVVPAAAHTPGLNDTRWSTDLAVFNPADRPVEVLVELLPEDRDNQSEVLSGIAFSLAPRATRVLADILSAIPGVTGDSLKGSLRVTFPDRPEPWPVVVSRTFNDTSDGTFGQHVPAVPTAGEPTPTVHLTGLAHNNEFRTNLGLANLGRDAASSVAVQVLDEHGVLLGSRTVSVLPWSSTMVVNVAAAAGVTGDLDLFSLRVEPGGAALAVYASVVDNHTGDPVLYLAGGPWDGTGYLLGLAHLDGAQGSTWRSDLSLLNPGSAASEVRVEYVPEVDPGFTLFISVPLGPEASFSVSDLVGSLLGPGSSSKGHARIWLPSGGAAPAVAARTYNQATTGTYGQGLPLLEGEALIPSGRHGAIAGVRGSADPSVGFRTNLGLVNTDRTTPATVGVVLYDLSGQEMARIDSYALTAGQYVQFELFGALGLAGLDLVGSVELYVSGGGPVAAYASVVDNRTQDPVFVPAQAW